MLEAKTLNVSIARPPHQVYAFVAEPANLPQWAAGLGSAVRCKGRQCTVETPQGTLQVRFERRNTLGVVDHYVSPAPGVEIYVPVRVVANGAGSEVLFTLFRQPEMSVAEFERDAALVQQDLAALKQLLEQDTP